MNSEPYEVSSVCLRLFLFLYSTRLQYFVVTYLKVAVCLLFASSKSSLDEIFSSAWNGRHEAARDAYDSAGKCCRCWRPIWAPPRAVALGKQTDHPFAQKSGGNWAAGHITTSAEHAAEGICMFMFAKIAR